MNIQNLFQEEMNMKKLLALIMALAMVLSLSATASAAENNQDASFSVVFKLANDGTISPEETFTFTFSNGTVTDAANGVSAPAISPVTIDFAEGAATAAGVTKQVTVPLSGINWPSVGVYTYDVKQTAGSTAGVSYDNKTLKMKVTVALDENTGDDAKYYVAFVTTTIADGNDDGITDVKSGSFENTYSAGSLAVTKNVTGNMGDRNRYFKITVTLKGEDGKSHAASYPVTGGSKLVNGTDDTSASTISVDTPADFYLKHDETFTIANLPYGVTYTVVEENYSNDGYTTTTTYSDEINKKIDTSLDTVTITNHKEATVDTGIMLDSLPYVLLLTVCVVCMVAFFVKKRSAREF